MVTTTLTWAYLELMRQVPCTILVLHLLVQDFHITRIHLIPMLLARTIILFCSGTTEFAFRSIYRTSLIDRACDSTSGNQPHSSGAPFVHSNPAQNEHGRSFGTSTHATNIGCTGTATPTTLYTSSCNAIVHSDSLLRLNVRPTSRWSHHCILLAKCTDYSAADRRSRHGPLAVPSTSPAVPASTVSYRK